VKSLGSTFVNGALYQNLGVRLTLAPARTANLIPSPSSIKQSMGTKSRSQHDGLTLARVQTGYTKAIGLRGVSDGLHGKPRARGIPHRMRYRETSSAHHNLIEHSLRYDDPVEEVAKQLKIAGRGQIHQRAAVGDDQGYPIWRRLSNSSIALASASQSSAM